MGTQVSPWISPPPHGIVFPAPEWAVGTVWKVKQWMGAHSISLSKIKAYSSSWTVLRDTQDSSALDQLCWLSYNAASKYNQTVPNSREQSCLPLHQEDWEGAQVCVWHVPRLTVKPNVLMRLSRTEKHVSRAYVC